MGVPLNFEPQPGVYFVSNVGLTKNPDGTYTITPGSTTAGGTPRTSQGGLFVPAAGVELANRPAYTSGVRFYLASGASIQLYYAPTGTAYNGATANTETINVAGVSDEPLSGTDTIFVMNVTGTVECRWVQQM